MVSLWDKEKKPLNKHSCRAQLAASGTSTTPFFGVQFAIHGQIFRKRRCLVPPKEFRNSSELRIFPLSHTWL